MIKEEKELREWWASIEFPHENKRDFFKDIRAFEKAVREGCASVAENCVVRSDNFNVSVIREGIAAAIRGRK
ncbi:MAG: hypothetical protein WCV62_05960 [Candidatus Peribacteraceae bacterium]|jgi:hypothetical protein